MRGYADGLSRSVTRPSGTVIIILRPHPMQLPRDTTHIGVVHVLHRETRNCLRRLAGIRYYLPAPAQARPDRGVSPGV